VLFTSTPNLLIDYTSYSRRNDIFLNEVENLILRLLRDDPERVAWFIQLPWYGDDDKLEKMCSISYPSDFLSTRTLLNEGVGSRLLLWLCTTMADEVWDGTGREMGRRMDSQMDDGEWHGKTK